jgi:hypothetical protein
MARTVSTAAELLADGHIMVNSGHPQVVSDSGQSLSEQADSRTSRSAANNTTKRCLNELPNRVHVSVEVRAGGGLECPMAP